MAKSMRSVSFDPVKCRSEITEFGALLASKPELSERDNTQPFFASHEHLSAFMGTYAPEIGPAAEIVFEYPIYGNFRADLIVGNKSAGAFLLVEFEDGRPDSVFRKTGRDLPEWGPRFEHGFSQIVDWFSLLDDLKKTDLFKKTFGDGYVSFSGLLVIGRDTGLVEEYDQIRLSWRSGNIALTSQPVVCITYDQLHAKLSWRLKVNTGQ